MGGFRGFPGTDRRGHGSRGGETKIGMMNLGGDRTYDDENAVVCRCGTDPVWQWNEKQDTRPEAQVGRWACVECGRRGPAHRSKACATLAWNAYRDEPLHGEPKRIKP